jgi:hypothetical protein
MKYIERSGRIRKSMLIIGSILCLFVLVSISYQPLVADVQSDGIIEYDLNRVDKWRFFCLGKIYNYSYSEIYDEDDILWKIHLFNCSKVLYITLYQIFPVITILKDGIQISIVESSAESFDIYYTGFINDNFICAIQVFKIY